MKNSSASNQIRLILRILNRYSVVIFIIIVASGLIGSIYVLTNIINQPYESDSSASSSATSFDEATINKLSSLEFGSKNTLYKNLPSGRIDPFSE